MGNCRRVGHRLEISCDRRGISPSADVSVRRRAAERLLDRDAAKYVSVEPAAKASW